MPARKIATFNQSAFMSTWCYRDDDRERKGVINNGACTVFSLLMVKLAMAGKNLAEIEGLFKLNLESIVKCQAEGAKAQASNADGYDLVLKALGLGRNGSFVPSSCAMFDIRSVDACIHVFDTRFAFGSQTASCHTIAHMRVGNLVYTFDPNYGIWEVPVAEWNDWILTFLTSNYTIATGSRFLSLKG